MSMFIAVCGECAGEVVFNTPGEAVRCYFGHVGKAPEIPDAYREATEEENGITLDAYRAVVVNVVFPYEAVRSLYTHRFYRWLAANNILLLSSTENPQRPWFASFTLDDGAFPQGNAMKAIAYWQRVLGKGITRSNLP